MTGAARARSTASGPERCLVYAEEDHLMLLRADFNHYPVYAQNGKCPSLEEAGAHNWRQSDRLLMLTLMCDIEK